MKIYQDQAAVFVSVYILFQQNKNHTHIGLKGEEYGPRTKTVICFYTDILCARRHVDVCAPRSRAAGDGILALRHIDTSTPKRNTSYRWKIKALLLLEPSFRPIIILIRDYLYYY